MQLDDRPVEALVRVRARKVWTVPSGGLFVAPIFGPPRIVQGRVRALDEHEIVIRMKIVERDLHIEFEDDGREFDPVTFPAPDLDLPLAERPVGGLGIHLVKSFVDRIDHRRSNGRNKLSLVKKAVVAAGAGPRTSDPGPCPSRDAG